MGEICFNGSAITYDAWGNPETPTGDTNIANLNPIRYRGYYYAFLALSIYLGFSQFAAGIAKVIVNAL